MASKKSPIKLIILAALVMAGGFLYLNAGNLVTRTAEKIASGALGVRVSIGSIDVSLSDKRVTVSRLAIGNPPGYSGANAMTADQILIGLNTASKELIDFKDIIVKGSVVNFEVNEHGVNLADLRKLANSKEHKESTGSEQVRVIVQHMVVDASTINPKISLINRDIKPIHMPAINFSNIGSGGGIKADAAITEIMTKYMSAVESAARDGGMLSGLPGNAEDVKKSLGDAANGLKSLFNK